MAEECLEQMGLLAQKVRVETVAWQALLDQKGKMVLLEDQVLLDFKD